MFIFPLCLASLCNKYRVTSDINAQCIMHSVSGIYYLVMNLTRKRRKTICSYLYLWCELVNLIFMLHVVNYALLAEFFHVLFLSFLPFSLSLSSWSPNSTIYPCTHIQEKKLKLSVSLSLLLALSHCSWTEQQSVVLWRNSVLRRCALIFSIVWFCFFELMDIHSRQ